MTKTNIKSRQSLIIAQIIKLWQKQTLGERERSGVSTYSEVEPCITQSSGRFTRSSKTARDSYDLQNKSVENVELGWEFLICDENVRNKTVAIISVLIIC